MRMGCRKKAMSRKKGYAESLYVVQYPPNGESNTIEEEGEKKSIFGSNILFPKVELPEKEERKILFFFKRLHFPPYVCLVNSRLTHISLSFQA